MSLEFYVVCFSRVGSVPAETEPAGTEPIISAEQSTMLPLISAKASSSRIPTSLPMEQRRCFYFDNT